ncbi:MAG: hypothetical protein HYS12_23405 [Planctomycetes bacterium]|nr:hypothetical protein [Planctomycetota bacterium]
MDEVLIPSVDDNKDAFRLFQAMYDAPAYARRARTTEAAYDHLLARCRRQRDEWLLMVRLRLGTAKALAGEWTALLPCLAEEGQLAQLEQMHAELAPKLRTPVAPTDSRRRLRAALIELRESIGLFNRRWQSHLPTVDLGHVNELREGHNRYYLLEKECALRSPRLARQGFLRLEPLTTADLVAALPLLPVPALR